jgi:acetyl esterase
VNLRIDPELAEVLATMPMDPAGHLADENMIRIMRSTPEILALTGAELPTDDRLTIEDSEVPGPPDAPPVPVRIYKPKKAAAALPALVYFHGGAFVIGDMYLEEHRCQRLAADGNCVVVSVDYRLAPENPFPAGVEDCYCALAWVGANVKELGVDIDRIGVGGASAGGALSAAVAQMARDRSGVPLAMQLLIYPVIDDRMETASMKAFSATPVWNSVASAQMWDHYLGVKRDYVSNYAAPGRSNDLADLPPAYIMTAEFDPLRDEGIAYGQRLLQAGISVELHNFPGTCHGFDLIAPNIELSRRAVDEQVAAVVRLLGQAPG